MTDNSRKFLHVKPGDEELDDWAWVEELEWDEEDLVEDTSHLGTGPAVDRQDRRMTPGKLAALNQNW